MQKQPELKFPETHVGTMHRQCTNNVVNFVKLSEIFTLPSDGELQQNDDKLKQEIKNLQCKVEI